MAHSPWTSSLLVAAHELRSMYRDRQTIVYSVLVPLGLYPAILWCLMQGFLYVQAREDQVDVRVGLAATEEGAFDRELVRVVETDASNVPQLVALQQFRAEQAELRGRGRPGGATTWPLPPREGIEVEPRREPLDPEAAETWLEEGAPPGALAPPVNGEAPPDVVMLLPGDARESEAANTKLIYRSSDPRSALAMRRVQDRIEPYSQALREHAVIERGHRPSALLPFDIESANVAPTQDMLAYALSLVLPMLLVVMCVMGAFFPAVDVTAGEKERKTAETTLGLPLDRRAIHRGKILAVGSAAVIATSLNLSALAVSIGHLLGMFSIDVFDTVSQLPVLPFLWISPLAILFAFLVSSCLCGIAVFSGSFREGQALLGPVQLLFIAPALIGILPGLELTPTLACIPIVNVVLAFRGLLEGNGIGVEYFICAASLLAFASLAMRTSLHLLSRESLMIRSESLPFRRWLRIARSSAQGR